MRDGERARQDDQPAVRHFREVRDAALDLARLAHASTFRDRVSVSGTGQFRPMRIPGSRSTATRVVRGAICLSISSHFALRPNSKLVKPVALSAVLAMLATEPPLKPPTCTNTIGIVRVICRSGKTWELVGARMTSGASATSSAAY